MTASLTDVFPREHLDGCFSKLKTQHPLTGAARPLTCGGLNFQARAAASARFAKYVLGPRETNFASRDVAGCIHRNVDHDFKTSLDRVLCVLRNVRHDLMQNTAPRSSRWRGLCLPREWRRRLLCGDVSKLDLHGLTSAAGTAG